jgi:hypothetical protein
MSGFSFSHGLGFYSIDRSAPSNENVLPVSSLYQIPAQSSNATILSTGLVGINTSNPAYPLDVSGAIHTTGNILCDGDTLSFTGNNPLPTYGCQIVANMASGELAVAGYSTNSNNYSRQVTLYENVKVAGNLTMTNNAATNMSLTLQGSNTTLQLCAPAGSGAYSVSAHPGDIVIRTMGSGVLYLQNNAGSPAMALSNNIVIFEQPVSFNSNVLINQLYGIYSPSSSYNQDGIVYVKPGQTSAFLAAPLGSGPAQKYNASSNSYTLGGTAYFNNSVNSWQQGIDASSTPVSYTRMRYLIQSFACSNGNSTTPNDLTVSFSFSNNNGTIQTPVADTGLTDTGISYSNIIPLVDQGSSFGAQLNVSPWYLSQGNNYGVPLITNLDSSKLLFISSVTCQYR